MFKKSIVLSHSHAGCQVKLPPRQPSSVQQYEKKWVGQACCGRWSNEHPDPDSLLR